MAFNRELAERVLAHIETLPTEGPGDVWDQGVWADGTGDWADGPPCGTAACFAGWTVFLSNNTRFTSDMTLYQIAAIPNEARRLLGISHAAGTKLFAVDNSLEDIRLAIKQLAERDGV